MLLNFESIKKKVEEVEQNRAEKKLNKEIQELTVNRYLGEQGFEVTANILENKWKMLIISPMKCGKTTYSFNDLYPVVNSCDMQFVFISPKVTLLQQVEANYKVNSCYGGASATVTGLPVVTTPDSLHKVIAECEAQRKPFIMVVDEFHETELNYNYRNKLARPIREFEHELCVGLIGLTATPDNIILSMEWDKVYQITPKEKFIQTPQTFIFSNLGNDVESIGVHILKVKKATNKPIVCRVNDKKKIAEVKKILNSMGINDVVTWFSNNPNEEEAKFLEEMLNGVRGGFEVLLCTSLVDVGVELYPIEKPIVIDFIDNNSRIIENIQFLGRFREGVEAYHIILTSTYSEKPFQEYHEIKEEMYKRANDFVTVFNKYSADILSKNDLVKYNFDVDQETFAYEVDTFGVNAKCFELYIKQIIQDKYKLKHFLENHFTFNSLKVTLVKLEDDYTNITEVKPVIEELKQERKVIKEQFKDELENLINHIAPMKDKELNVFLTKPDEVTIGDKWIIETFEEEYNFYWSEDMKEHRKRFYSLEAYTKRGHERKDLLLKALDKDWYNQFKKQAKYINSNLMYENKAQVYIIDEAIGRTKLLVYDIRKAITGMKGKEVGVSLSGKFLNQLHERMIEKSKYEKLTEKALMKHLELIYNISEDRNKRVTSIKTIINLETI